jgi:hypothetical protein
MTQQELDEISQMMQQYMAVELGEFQAMAMDFSNMGDRVQTENIPFLVHPDLVAYTGVVHRAINTTLQLGISLGRELRGDLFCKDMVLGFGFKYSITHDGSEFSQMASEKASIGAIAMGPGDINETSIWHEAVHMAERLYFVTYEESVGKEFYEDLIDIASPECPFHIGDFSWDSFARWFGRYWREDPQEYWVVQCYRHENRLTQHTDTQIAVLTHSLLQNYVAMLAEYGLPRKELERLSRQVIFNRLHPQDIRGQRDKINRAAKAAGIRV